MNFSQYTSYKECEAGWIGNIPTHWECKRAKYYCFETEERSLVNEGTLLSVSEYFGVRPRADVIGDQDTLQRAETLEGYKVAHEGDLVINIMLAWKRGLGIAPCDGLVSPSYAVFRFKNETFPQFAGYLLRTNAYIQEFKRWSSGIIDSRLRLYPEDFLRTPLISPPMSEQSVIAAFLDAETEKIDALIKKKERLIALLGEKRQAVISHVVTKGLNPSATMKDSGIEWLGRVPAHWAIKRVKHLITFITSGSRGWAEFYADDGADFLQSGNIGQRMELDLTQVQKVQPPPGAEGVRTTVRKDDVLVCITGGRTGAVAQVREKLGRAYINQHVALQRPAISYIDPRFLSYVLWSPIGGQQFDFSRYGLKEGLGLEDVLNVLVPTPPIDEQRDVVARLDTRLTAIDRLIEKTKAAISRLRERRESLIAAAVTGKIDVRSVPAENVVLFSSRQRRNVLAAEVIRQFHNDNTFGRTKAQKVFYLLNAHLGVSEFEGQYERWIAGPYDAGMMKSVAAELESAGWFREIEDGSRYHYRQLIKAGEVRTAFVHAWAERKDEIEEFLKLLRPLDTQQAEVIATLYAAWNDLLLRGEEVDDGKLLTEVTTNWHEAKKAIPERAWKDGLRWLRQHGVVPKGTGSQTIQQMSLGL